MSSPAYQQMAADLRAAIGNGTYPAGSTLPKITDLAQQYGVAKQTAREALAQLEAEGLVDIIRRRGTVVRARPVRRRLTRGRQVHRDARGYFFDAAAQPWTALEPPTITWAPAPHDIAALLQLADDARQDVLVRDRLMGDPATQTPLQLATSYLPASLARGTRLAHKDTGPGGIYDLLESMGHTPLSWEEAVSARMPTPTECEQLHLPKGVPLLRITRTTTSPDGTVLEVNDTRMSADTFEIGYTLTRHPSAQRP
ncbi:GntR family transcriptional regulator [Streptomyces spiroverticillatus]|uniref:GntR family transcriptional regulator n=1 Tax=Streptomyces finlayi TaxID=67296 RepID=A0A918X788_9ACTN|nr:GntR family transcriptional regulator [Streptomyces finlayi]GHA46531.1 GntR family transcriptional regulator [Streptomyces spiroverticillatus]GHD16219.1 GntR family transcriptional regulator [Streptomyces finlayi]